MLGLQITSPQGVQWALAPHLSGLGATEGGFETGLGWFGVKWTLDKGARRWTAKLATPSSTSGVVTLPREARGGNVSVDGREVTAESSIFPLTGGNHTIVACF